MIKIWDEKIYRYRITSSRVDLLHIDKISLSVRAK